MIRSAVIDWAPLRSLRELQGPDQPDIVATLVQTFSNVSALGLSRLHQAVGDGDAEAVRHAAHSLRGCAGQIGAVELARVSQQLEACTRTAGGELASMAEVVSVALREALIALGAGDPQARSR
jgi:HPt (histidine-containing phosphotransfer) domain-containing protein